MITLLAGVKGTGKTKRLLEHIAQALETSKGDVVVLEKGTKLRFDVSYQARLIDADEYNVSGEEALYGFIAGILASNSDVTDIFADGVMKICQGSIESFEKLVVQLQELVRIHNVRIVLTASLDPEQLSADIRALCE